MMFERHHEPLLPLPRFFGRMAKSLGIAATINGVTLAMGAVGLRRLEGLDWMDACLNAALVMTGNGPIAPAQSVSGKTFLLFYALGGVLVFAKSETRNSKQTRICPTRIREERRSVL
jgi:hypothetical protein